jgi:uncharacterized protein (TIGR03067 family)
MWTPAVLALTVGLLLGFAAPVRADEEAIARGRKALAGTWQAVSYALDGQKVAAEDLKHVRLHFDADGLAIAQRDGKTFLASKTTIDPTMEPATMDIAFIEGNDKGRTSLGLYRIEGDVLTICRSAPGKPRPSSFSSEPGSGLTLMSCRRVQGRGNP